MRIKRNTPAYGTEEPNFDRIRQPETDLRVCVDVEQVLANSHEAFLTAYNAANGTNLTAEDWTAWELDSIGVRYYEFMGMSDAVWRYSRDEIEPVFDDMGEAFARLTQLADVDIVTARLGVEREMCEWLAANGVGGHRLFLSTDVPKGELGYDVYVDDNPHMVGTVPIQFAPKTAYGPELGDEGVVLIDSLSDVADSLEKDYVR